MVTENWQWRNTTQSFNDTALSEENRKSIQKLDLNNNNKNDRPGDDGTLRSM